MGVCANAKAAETRSDPLLQKSVDEVSQTRSWLGREHSCHGGTRDFGLGGRCDGKIFLAVGFGGEAKEG